MALKKDAIKRLKELGIDYKALSAAIADENEVDIALPDGKLYKDEDGQLFTTAELATRDKEKYESGKKAGVEMGIDELKTAKGFDFKGKTLEKLVEHLESKNDNDGVIKKLRENLTASEKKAIDAEERAGKIEHQSAVHAIIPEYKGYTKRELQALAEANGYDVKKEDGKMVLYKDGVKQLDTKLATPVDAAIGLKDFFEKEKKMSNEPETPPAGGRQGGGGGNGKPKNTIAVFDKLSEVRTAYKEKTGKENTNGEDFFNFLSEAQTTAKAAGKELVMD